MAFSYLPVQHRSVLLLFVAHVRAPPDRMALLQPEGILHETNLPIVRDGPDVVRVEQFNRILFSGAVLRGPGVPPTSQRHVAQFRHGFFGTCVLQIGQPQLSLRVFESGFRRDRRAFLEQILGKRLGFLLGSGTSVVMWERVFVRFWLMWERDVVFALLVLGFQKQKLPRGSSYFTFTARLKQARSLEKLEDEEEREQKSYNYL